jgi:xanthine dehydrogenase accessory factor
LHLSKSDADALKFLIELRRRGEAAALLTLVRADGSAPRPVGSHVAVSQAGRAIGHITGGCAEAALAAEAVDAIRSGAGRVRRYGAGSPYVDVKLPCGSGIDVLFSVEPDCAAIEAALLRLSQRRPAALKFDLAGGGAKLSDEGVTRFNARAGVFVRSYLPTLKVEIVGKGPAAAALACLAQAGGFAVALASPEEETRASVRDCGIAARALSSPTAYEPGALDRWTAAAVMFHEHDWDPPVIARLLRSACFYVGALGSRRTHEERIGRLRALGVDERRLGEVCGPIGLDIGAKSPEEIAISTLAEIVKAARVAQEGARWRR